MVISDLREGEMPNVGLVRLQDSETGDTITLDTASLYNRKLFAQLSQLQTESRDGMFRRQRLEPLQLETGRDLVEPLRPYLHKRERRQ